MAAIGALRRLAASALALGRIRAELLAIELQEEKRRIAAVLFWSVLGALAAGFASVFVALAITVWLWDTHREWVVTACALGLAALAAMAVWRTRALLAVPSTLFEASLAELRRDEAALRGAVMPQPPAQPAVRPVAPSPVGAPTSGAAER